MQDREHEPEIARHRCLTGEQQLDPFFDPDVPFVDVVVERDHFVCELLVTLLERVDRAAQRAENERAFLLQRRFEQVELFLERRSRARRTR